MFTTGVFNQIPMSFPYPGQQPSVSVYPSQYGGYAPQVQPPFQQAPLSTRGQSVPASGPYPPTSSQRNGQYLPPAPSQHHGYHRHGSKSSKKHRKRRSASPRGVADQSLYSDKEEKNDRSRSPSLVLGSQSKEEGEANSNEQERRSPTVESANADVSQGRTIITDEQEKQQRQSRSKKKKHYRQEQYRQTPPFYGELPPQMRIHQQPLYSGYSQAYEESLRRGDMYQKQVKRSTRLPPEVKQQLLPHEDDHQKQYPFARYPQQPFRPSFNPYLPGFFSKKTPYNASQPWSNVPRINPGPAEHEIQRLRGHIHTLEGELHKLQKKLNKTSINPDENYRSHRRSKADDHVAPRQTPVIVELNNGEMNPESSSKKKHRHRTASSPQGLNPLQPTAENSTEHNSSNQQQADARERSRSGRNQLSEPEGKAPPRTLREKTAALLAHAAAAHVNARQQVPPPPPVQQQYVYQPEAFSPQSQQIRGAAPRFSGQGNVRHPVDPAQQRNFNQSNNSELVTDNDERRNRHSADKILDAFERFYMNKSSTAPMKVKYIPEDNNNIHQRNTNNNNNYGEKSFSECSSSSSSSN